VVANQLNAVSLVDDYRAVQPVIIDKTTYTTSSRDTFEFVNVRIDDDLLIVDVSFSGSHTGHDFILIGTGDFMESSPIQTSLVLSHDSKKDLGEAWLTKELIFDLKPLKKEFFSVYSFFSPDDILLQISLEGYGEVMYSL
jgi:hypothetical protein